MPHRMFGKYGKTHSQNEGKVLKTHVGPSNYYCHRLRMGPLNITAEINGWAKVRFLNCTANDFEWAKYLLRGRFRCIFVGLFKFQQMPPMIVNGSSVLSESASDAYA
jgi:hypothetical protein